MLKKEIILTFAIILLIFSIGFFLRIDSANLNGIPEDEKSYYQDLNEIPYMYELDSYYNYRLTQNRPRQDWPNNLRGVYKKKHLTLNTIVKRMTNKQIRGFSPYKTLVYWTKNVNIIITMDKLQELLNFFGYKYDDTKYKRKNVSKKTRGKFDENTRKRIAKIFKSDILLYNMVKKHIEKSQTLDDHA